MHIPGPVASRQIQQSRHGAQAALSEARGAASLTSQELLALAAEIRETLAVLVPQSLSATTSEAILAASIEADEAIQEILRSRAERVSRLDGELAQLDRERAAAEEDLERITATLDRHWSRQQEISNALAQHLAGDESFKRWAEEAAETEAALERAEASLAEIEYDATQKLPAYEKSRLFKYLYDRRMGTPRYVAGPTNQRIDNWIAGLIDYPKAKVGYDFLKNTPEQVREWMAGDRDRLAPLMKQLERRRDEQAADLGLLQIADEVHRAEQNRETVLTRLEQVRRKKDAKRRELAEIEDAGGAYYLPVFERIETLLEQTERYLLEIEAAPISAPRANRIIARLRAFASQRQSIQLQAMGREHRIVWLNRHLSELGYFHQRFCSAGFDSSRSYLHDSLDLVRDLERVREGNDSVDLVWQRMRLRQQFGPPDRDASRDGLARSDRPLSRVLASAMTRAVCPPMSGFARRAATRWTNSHRGGWRSAG